MPLAVPPTFNQVWSADFMSDALWNGRRFRTFNVIDDFNREALTVEIDTGISAQRVVRILDQIADWRGLPARIRFDNGPEFTALAVADWAEENGVELEFIKPGKPTDNAFIESFNGSFRDECLNVNWFLSLEDAREKISAFKEEYNHFRPHSALGNMTPIEALDRTRKSSETLL